MSVLLNMKKPKNCDECRFNVDGWCYVLRPESEEERRRIATNYCPLTEVPTQHGRLIDADALLDLLNNCVFPSDMVTTTAVRMAMNWIKDSPTVIEEEDGEE